MAGKTVKDLKAVRANLVELRRQEAYRVSGAPERTHRVLVRAHQAIEALDAVIAEGKDEPKPDHKQTEIL
jgi:hypothetical protein